ncbi:hypothetical protein [Colwellia psychrerythraea]|uniref:STAS/SEC14 domain-containing protein n=1 Tax=Colwellia psychrerythraea TaxID=28229 RepID=A0A099KX78_COLPS|nr:hypothetical protein [Colwellia psychrerythraea]KGJ95176.1 hypothetical protein GAB14E_1958 [Colwellia psychrerythraea]
MATEHGESSISVDGDIIFVKAIGSFNLEGIVKVITELKLIIESFAQKDFKLLFDYTQTEGATPEVFEKINECNIWLNNQNMVAKAVIINSQILMTILESRTPARDCQNSKQFEDKASAITWLKSQSIK